MSWLRHVLADFAELRLLARILQTLGDATLDEIEAMRPGNFLGPGYLWYLRQFDHHHHGGDLGTHGDHDQVL